MTQQSKAADELADAYDVLGVLSDDPMEMIESIYTRKAMFYHPDKGGNGEKFKRIAAAIEIIRKARGTKAATP